MPVASFRLSQNLYSENNHIRVLSFILSGAPAHRGTFFVIAAAVKNSPG
jgi:hypothetical protein